MGGLGFPTGGLYNRIEGMFLCNKTQFCVNISLKSIKLFSCREGYSLATANAIIESSW